MRLTSQRKWYDLNYIQAPEEIKELIRQCKELDFQLDLISICVNRRAEFPNNYMINLRTRMHGILTSYLTFLRKYVKDEETRMSLTEDLIELRKMLISKEEEIIESEPEKRWERIEQYLTIYKEFLYSYLFNTIKMAEEESIKDLPTKIAELMIARVGILKISKEEKEDTNKIIFKKPLARKEPEAE